MCRFLDRSLSLEKSIGVVGDKNGDNDNDKGVTIDTDTPRNRVTFQILIQMKSADFKQYLENRSSLLNLLKEVNMGNYMEDRFKPLLNAWDLFQEQEWVAMSKKNNSQESTGA